MDTVALFFDNQFFFCSNFKYVSVKSPYIEFLHHFQLDFNKLRFTAFFWWIQDLHFCLGKYFANVTSSVKQLFLTTIFGLISSIILSNLFVENKTLSPSIFNIPGIMSSLNINLPSFVSTTARGRACGCRRGRAQARVLSRWQDGIKERHTALLPHISQYYLRSSHRREVSFPPNTFYKDGAQYVSVLRTFVLEVVCSHNLSSLATSDLITICILR